MVIGEPVNLEVVETGKRYRLNVEYLSQRFVYLSLPVDENKQVVELEPGTEIRLVVANFGKMFVYNSKIEGLEDRDPPRLIVDRSGPPEEAINRANLRMNVQIITQVRVLAADGSVKKTIKGDMLDISAGGGRLRLTESLERDTQLHINFPLHGADPVDSPAKVVRAFPPVRRGVYEMALQFTGEGADPLGDRVVKWIMDQQRKRVGR